MTPREESLDDVEREIAREKAEALGRTGERLERLLGELEALASELRQPEGSVSPELVGGAEHRYEALRARALEARRDLMAGPAATPRRAR